MVSADATRGCSAHKPTSQAAEMQTAGMHAAALVNSPSSGSAEGMYIAQMRTAGVHRAALVDSCVAEGLSLACEGFLLECQVQARVGELEQSSIKRG